VTGPGSGRRLVALPARGTVQPADVPQGSRLPAGAPVGVARTRREEVHVSPGSSGVQAERLVQQGDRVDAGDPPARPYPEVPQ